MGDGGAGGLSLTLILQHIISNIVSQIVTQFSWVTEDVDAIFCK